MIARLKSVIYVSIELATLLDLMVHKDLQLTAVFDCCYLGVIPRGGRTQSLR